MAAHECEYPQFLIEKSDEDGNLRAGMQVLVPCECGETPLDHLEFMQRHLTELQEALLGYQPYRPLYHWAPAARRKQILRYGLRPGMRPTTSDGGMGAPCVCLADSPSWAWALSGQQRSHPPGGEWDLWQTYLDRLTDPLVLATEERPSGLYEVRTEHRIYKRDLWYAGSRVR